MLKLITVLFLCISIFPMGTGIAKTDVSYTVYYLPLEVQFYVPPTDEYIEKYGTKLANLKSVKIDALFDQLSGVDKSKDVDEYKMKRVKIINNMDGKVLYLTSNKKVLFENYIYKVDKKLVDAVIKVIVNAVEVEKAKKK